MTRTSGAPGRPGAVSAAVMLSKSLEPAGLVLAVAVEGRGPGVEEPPQGGPGVDGLVDDLVRGAELGEGLGEGEVGQADVAEVHAVAHDDGRAHVARELAGPDQEA